jgi:membrane protein
LIELVGPSRVVTARRVVARYNAVDGTLLAAGLAYNAMLALIPIALLVAAIAGFVLTDPESQARFIRAVLTFAPPLAGIVEEIVKGLATASTSLSIIGLVLALWGTSRLFASLESGVSQMFAGYPTRGFVNRAVRRIGAVAILAFLLTAALVVVPILWVGGETVRGTGSLESVMVTAVLLAVALGLASLALTALYRLMPPILPTWHQVLLPSFGAAIALLVITRGFTILAPALFGANAIYGTLGAIFLGLAWLDLVFMVILLGGAWVAERAPEPEATVA